MKKEIDNKNSRKRNKGGLTILIEKVVDRDLYENYKNCSKEQRKS
jgi:hypothetical protein